MPLPQKTLFHLYNLLFISSSPSLLRLINPFHTKAEKQSFIIDKNPNLNHINIMAAKNKEKKIVPINRTEASEQCAIISGYENGRRIPRLKELKKVRGNCYYTSGVSAKIADFAYRAVVQLGLRDKKFLFSRGAVKRNNRPIITSCRITELDWDVGTEITIPNKLNYERKIELMVDGEKHSIRLMEIIVLTALLRIACPHKSDRFFSEKSAAVIAKGWACYHENRKCHITRLP